MVALPTDQKVGEFVSVGGCKVCRHVPRGHFLFTCWDTCCGMSSLATMHFVTDRQTDRQTDDSMMPTADHTACSISG